MFIATLMHVTSLCILPWSASLFFRFFWIGVAYFYYKHFSVKWKNSIVYCVLCPSLWYNIFVRKLTWYYPIIGESLDIVSTLVHLEPYLSISIIKGNDQWKRSTTNANISLCCFSIIHYLLHVATIIFLSRQRPHRSSFYLTSFSFQFLCGYIFIF